jgi:anti-sigma factor RsiW
MPDCSSIDPLVTAYVDGELPAADARTVDTHVQQCPPCRARVQAEASIRDLIQTRKPALR